MDKRKLSMSESELKPYVIDCLISLVVGPKMKRTTKKDRTQGKDDTLQMCPRLPQPRSDVMSFVGEFHVWESWTEPLETRKEVRKGTTTTMEVEVLIV